MSSAAIAENEKPQAVNIVAANTLSQVLQTAMEKKAHVFIRLKSGQEYSTKNIRSVSGAAVVIGKPAGREYYDAYILLDSVAAVEVRVQD